MNCGFDSYLYESASTLEQVKQACIVGFAGRTCFGFAYYSSGSSYQLYDISMYYNQQPIEAPGTRCAGSGSGAGLRPNADWDIYTRILT